MKRLPRGYTIIEVMMFLLVSSALLGSVMTMISGRQERTRFTTSVESFERKLNDIFNDVSTGFYPSAENISCRDTTSGLSIQSSATKVDQGTNVGCVFLGKAVEFKTGGAPSNYTTYTIVASQSATGLNDAKVELLGAPKSSGGTLNPGIKDNGTILADIEVVKAVRTGDGNEVSGVAIISDFSQTSVLDNKVSGNAARVSLYQIPNPFINNAGRPTMAIADQGVTVCLQQGTGGRKAAVLLGSNGGRLSTEIVIDNLPGVCN